ncbi:MAG: magnesium/cobalt transporter CorA [Verrucomicrobiota bacterium]|jgi:magnesium transporter
MLKFHYSLPGTSPATLSVPTGTPNTPPRLRFARYDESFLETREIASVSELPQVTPDGPTLWVELDGLSDLTILKELGQKFGLHPLALEDVLSLGQRPKVEPYDNHIFIVAQMICNDDTGTVTGEQVSLFLGPGFLISIEEDPKTDTFAPVHERLKGGRGIIRKQRADYLTYALLDAIVDHHFPMLESLGEALQSLDDEVVANPSPSQIHRLHECKRLLASLRRYVWPERDVISALLHDESGLIRRESKVYLRDCYDHTIQVMDLIESYRDVASGLMEMYLSCVGLRTNEIMRVLTVVSSIFIPLTFLAGVWGMNFQAEKDGHSLPWNMPELHMPYAYPACLALMSLIALAQILYFKRRKWL